MISYINTVSNILWFFSRTAGEIAIYAGLPGLLIPLIAGAYKVLEAIKRSDKGEDSILFYFVFGKAGYFSSIL